MIRILAFLVLMPLAAQAQDYPQPITDTVSDFANLLDPAQEADLTKTLQTGRDETGVHITVVTMLQIADYGGNGQSIETYAKNLFNAWGIGDAKRNDGILILVAKDDREMRIALGRGYDAVYDGYAQRVIDRDMLPRFRQDDYAGGIALGAVSAIESIAKPFAAHATPRRISNQANPKADKFIFGGIVAFFVAVFVGIFGLIFRHHIGDLATLFRTCPQCGSRGLSRKRDTILSATDLQEGSGMQTTTCRNCGYTRHETYVKPPLAQLNSSGGGGSGFGGGRSSGGGASGRW